MIENVDEPAELGADYKVEVSLPASEQSQGEAGNQSGSGKSGDEETGDERHGDEEPERPPVSGASPSDPSSDKADGAKKEATTKLRSIALLPLMIFFTWPVLDKMITVWHLMTIFLRVGTVTFGGGYVMVPQIETDVVQVHQWMDHQTFADGVAFGQITPGPVLITATFIGYKVAGVIGAITTTIAAFLPSFIMTMIAGASINRFRANFHVQAFLAGVAPAVVGMLAAAGVTMAKSGVSGATGFGLATLACLLMLRAKLNPVVIIFGCGLLQWAISRGLLNAFVF
jgi:chromate transporter